MTAHFPFRKSVTKAPTWPSCFACPLLQAECSVSACWTPSSTRLVHTDGLPQHQLWKCFRTAEKHHYQNTQVPSCVQSLKPFSSYFFFLENYCFNVDTKRLKVFFPVIIFSLLLRITWFLLQGCFWDWTPPQDQDIFALYVWQGKTQFIKPKDVTNQPCG